MQFANIEVAIGGDQGNRVPRYAVSAAEIAVLRQIHGEDAIVNVEPAEGPADDDGKPVKVNEREELQRLRELYSGAVNEEGQRHVDLVYPMGAKTSVVTTLSEAGLTEESMKPKTRASMDEQVVVRPPRAPGTRDPRQPMPVGDRSQEGDAMLPAIPPGDLARVVDTSALGTAGATSDDFLK